MLARSTDEPHRASSQLELLFDLTFVVAVAALTAQFAAASPAGTPRGARAVPAGVLRDLVGVDELHVVRVGVRHRRRRLPPADPGADGRRARARRRRAGRARPPDYRAVTFGYVVMRIGLVALWLRAAIEDPARPPDRAALRRRDQRPAAGCGRRWYVVLCRASRRASACSFAGWWSSSSRCRAGPNGRAHHLASAPHRRALRPVHDHPARRERPRRVDRSRNALGAARSAAPRRVAPRASSCLRAVVAVLPRTSRRRTGRASPPFLRVVRRWRRHLLPTRLVCRLSSGR